ncbi:hypothetical protein MRX96_017450 [Rhipicephalus microplus]
MADDVTPSLTAHPSHFPTCTKPESGSHFPSQAECCPKSPVTQRCCGPSITEKLPELPRTPTIIALAFEEFFVGQICAMLSSITALIVFMEQ